MAYTVSAAFDQFYNRINLSGDHRDTANARRDRIVSLLRNHFDILEAFASGSIPKFTALHGRADLDVIVALHYSKHIQNNTPLQVLQTVRDALSQYRTNVRKNGQAVTLYYNTWPNVDIVPVSRSVDKNGNVTHYNVPDANTGQWMPSRPQAHARAIFDRSSSCGQNFRRIIKMVKHWNLVHSRYLRSYHIEVLALRALDGNLDDTAWNVLRFFNEAKKLLQTPLWHNLGYVDDYLSFSDRQEVLKRVETAIVKSRSAWHCTYNGNFEQQSAITLWRQVFGDKFPAYG